jgi:hypothetical protein
LNRKRPSTAKKSAWSIDQSTDTQTTLNDGGRIGVRDQKPMQEEDEDAFIETPTPRDPQQQRPVLDAQRDIAESTKKTPTILPYGNGNTNPVSDEAYMKTFNVTVPSSEVSLFWMWW